MAAAVAALVCVHAVALGQGLGLRRYRDHALHADGTTVSCGFQQQLIIVDVKDLDHPVVHARLSVGQDITSIKVCRGYILVGTMGGGLHVYDTANVENIRRVSLFSDLSEIYGMDVHGKTIAVAAGVRGFAEVDASDIKNLRMTAVVNTPGEACDVALSGGHLFVADGPGGLHVAGRAPDGQWTIRHTVRTTDASLRVAVGDGPLVVLSDRTSLRLFEFSDEPVMLRETGTYRSQRLSAAFVDLWPAGPLVYVAAHMGGLEVVDCSRRESPQQVGSLVSGSEATAIASSGDQACVLLKNGNVRVLDIANRRRPAEQAVIGLDRLPVLQLARP